MVRAVNVSFRPVGKRERAILESLGIKVPTTHAGWPSLWCVTIDGFPVVAFAGDQVFYQDGSDAVPDLIRASRRVASALGALEQNGVSARAADDFIRNEVFEAWWDWDYEPAVRTDA